VNGCLKNKEKTRLNSETTKLYLSGEQQKTTMGCYLVSNIDVIVQNTPENPLLTIYLSMLFP
jgi:hypothetical protein